MDAVQFIMILKGLAEQLINIRNSKNVKKDDVSSIQKELVNLEADYSKLALEHDDVRNELKSVKSQLEIVIAQYQTNYIDELEEQILKYIHIQDKDVSKNELCNIFKSRSGDMQYHIDILSKKEYITPIGVGKIGAMTYAFSGGDSSSKDSYSITLKGRSYLFDNNLI